MALEAIDILLENGAKPNNIILGHIDRNPDYYYHEQIAKRGVFLIYDGAARVKYYTDEVIARLIEHMVEAGFEDQLLMGADLGGKSYFRSYEGGPGLGYNLGIFTPRLLASGISQQTVDKMRIHNARRAFTNKKAGA